MKPFIAPELTAAGKKRFAFQCEGVASGDLWGRVQPRELLAYGLYAGHTLQSAWGLSFFLDSGLVLEFSAASTLSVGWQEVGSLNVLLALRSPPDAGSAPGKLEEVAVQPIRFASAEKLVYEDDDVVVECGLVLCGTGGQQVVIAAGVAPGSVSVEAPFSAGQSFEPKFQWSACRRQRL